MLPVDELGVEVIFSHSCTSVLPPISKRFQAEFCTETDFLPNFHVSSHEMIRSGQLSSEGYLYRY